MPSSKRAGASASKTPAPRRISPPKRPATPSCRPRKTSRSYKSRSAASGAGIAAGGDGGNDLPYSTQRLHELGCRIEEAALRFGRTRRNWPSSSGTSARRPSGNRPRARFASVAPKESVVWRRRVGNDTPVQAESPLLDLVNPSEVFIDAVIGESDLKRVQCGGAARVRLPGSRKEWKAVVKQVFGHDLPWPDACLAASAVRRRNRRSTSSSASPNRRPTAAGRSFPVGLPAEVTFVSTGEALKGCSWRGK